MWSWRVLPILWLREILWPCAVDIAISHQTSVLTSIKMGHSSRPPPQGRWPSLQSQSHMKESIGAGTQRKESHQRAGSQLKVNVDLFFLTKALLPVRSLLRRLSLSPHRDPFYTCGFWFLHQFSSRSGDGNLLGLGGSLFSLPAASIKISLRWNPTLTTTTMTLIPPDIERKWNNKWSSYGK